MPLIVSAYKIFFKFDLQQYTPTLSVKTLYTSSLPGRTILLDQEEYLYFSGTSYLGIGHQPIFRDTLYEGIDKYGTIYSVSRHNNVQLDIYDEVEAYLASVNQAESALTVSSGLLAGQLVLRSEPRATIWYAPGVHPALWHQSKIPHQFENSEDFYLKIAHEVIKSEGPVMICCNTIDPLYCQSTNFEWIKTLPANRDITLVFDDSHALGVRPYLHTFSDSLHGKSSYSFLRSITPHNIHLVVISSLAKASGIPGGVVLADKKMIEAIRSMSYFAGASPISPSYLYAFMRTKQVYDSAHQQLIKNIKLFKKLNVEFLRKSRSLDDYPVFFTQRNDLYPKLLGDKILISSFAYPDPEAPPITRLVISALHTDADIITLSHSIRSYI